MEKNIDKKETVRFLLMQKVNVNDFPKCGDVEIDKNILNVFLKTPHLLPEEIRKHIKANSGKLEKEVSVKEFFQTLQKFTDREITDKEIIFYPYRSKDAIGKIVFSQ